MKPGFDMLTSIRSVFYLLLWLGVGLVVAGCAREPWQGFSTAVDPVRVWPASPETPRVAWVAQVTNREDLFESAGFWESFKTMLGGERDTSLVRPFAVGLLPGGGLLVTDPGARVVHCYDWSRRRYVALGADLPGGLPSPVGVAALGSGASSGAISAARILVSDSRLNRVLVFDRDGKPMADFCTPGTIGRPAGIAVNAATGEVHIADVTGHRVIVTDGDGRILRTLGRHGAGPGELNFPTHLALDGQGRLLVTDSMNFRIQLFAADGTFIRQIGRHGDAPGLFSNPKGVAADGHGNLIAVEGLHDALEFFSEQGELLLHLGQPGQGPGEFWLPAGLAFDPADNLLFVADSYNRRVQVFRMIAEAGADALDFKKSR